MKEEMEELNIEGGEKEKSIIERLEEFKTKKVEAMKEDNVAGPWNLIDTGNLIEESKKLFDIFDGGNIKLAPEEFRVAKEKLEEIKDKKVKSSNEAFLNWIDGEIEAKLLQEQLKEQRERDNN